MGGYINPEVRILSFTACSGGNLPAAAVAARAAIVRILNCILIKRSENVENEVNEVSWIISTSVCFR